MPGIIPRSTNRAPGWINILLWTSLIILVITLVGYFGIKKGISSLGDEIKETQQKIISIETPENQKIEKSLLIYQAQANYFTQALAERRYPTEAFALLTSFDFNQEKYQISLQGYASSFQVVGEQLSVMREDEFIQEAEITSLTIGEKGEINLGITLKLLSSLFK